MVTHIRSTAQQTDCTRCRVCRHPLTARKSVAAGIGPICARRTTIRAAA